jgi:putative ABC transport system ATP-binding protein
VEEQNVEQLSEPVVRVQGLRKVYSLGDSQVIALAGIDLEIRAGEFVAVMGPSGSGKSTFMQITGLLDNPTDGHYYFEGTDVSHLDADARADIRSRRLGFVFQSYNLLSRTSALENVELPMVYAGVPAEERASIAHEKMGIVGVAHLAGHNPNQMSGGQQQRVAIARSLVNNPGLILADEPTGALDSEGGLEVLELFRRLHAGGQAILLVTHDEEVAAPASRIIRMRDGRVEDDGTGNAQPEPVGGSAPSAVQ